MLYRKTPHASPSPPSTRKLASHLTGAGVQRRSRNGVVVILLIDIDQDARVRGRIELLARRRARRLGGPAARDLQIDALRIVLGAVGAAGGMQGDELVADDVAPRGEGRGDGEGPGVVIGDELLGRPAAGAPRGEEAGLVDFEELERGLVVGDARARAVAVGHVGEDGAEVGAGPRRPEQFDLLAGGHGDVECARCGGVVADDVGGLVGARRDETDADVVVGPPGHGRRRVHVGIGGRIVALVEAVADFDLLHVAMRGHARGESAGDGGKSQGVHDASPSEDRSVVKSLAFSGSSDAVRIYWI